MGTASGNDDDSKESEQDSEESIRHNNKQQESEEDREINWLVALDSDLFITTNSKPKMTRSQKRDNHLKYARAEDTEEHLDVTS